MSSRHRRTRRTNAPEEDCNCPNISPAEMNTHRKQYHQQQVTLTFRDGSKLDVVVERISPPDQVFVTCPECTRRLRIMSVHTHFRRFCQKRLDPATVAHLPKYNPPPSSTMHPTTTQQRGEPRLQETRSMSPRQTVTSRREMPRNRTPVQPPSPSPMLNPSPPLPSSPSSSLMSLLPPSQEPTVDQERANLITRLGLTIDESSGLLFCSNGCRDRQYVFVKTDEAYQHIITAHRALRRHVEAVSEHEFTELLYRLGSQRSDVTDRYSVAASRVRDMIPRVNLLDPPVPGYRCNDCPSYFQEYTSCRSHRSTHHGDSDVTLNALFARCMVQRLGPSQNMPYFGHEGIMKHYGVQNLDRPAHLAERRAIGRFHETMRWDMLVRRVLTEEDTTDSRSRLASWISLPEVSNKIGLSIVAAVTKYMKVVDKATRGASYYLERRMVMGLSVDDVPTRGLTELLQQSHGRTYNGRCELDDDVVVKEFKEVYAEYSFIITFTKDTVDAPSDLAIPRTTATFWYDLLEFRLRSSMDNYVIADIEPMEDVGIGRSSKSGRLTDDMMKNVSIWLRDR
ncbi:hypothetical protein BDB00DRAFT_934487 [Zychaea mexicana]|uniref:uncharacterized protein n=1 Tax=Zychaea mexicana TaxID=64656 RepID=UPI0022FE2B20|nr:uncharacterized protein BDB00DRAFT_934487 [Zychaea mexicana]KAI9469137.1 hypothetical protein BDB00DRAFT_934487 [Zychaea mexicana]